MFRVACFVFFVDRDSGCTLTENPVKSHGSRFDIFLPAPRGGGGWSLFRGAFSLAAGFASAQNELLHSEANSLI